MYVTNIPRNERLWRMRPQLALMMTYVASSIPAERPFADSADAAQQHGTHLHPRPRWTCRLGDPHRQPQRAKHV